MPLTISEEKPEITKFLENHQIGVLASADKAGRPHAAAIYFAIDTNLNFYFLTKEKTTKCRNIQENPQASLVVYEPKTQTTVQAHGVIAPVEDESRIKQIFNRILDAAVSTSESSVPPVSRITGGQYKAFRLEPNIIRMAVFTKPEHNSDDIFETVVVPERELN